MGGLQQWLSSVAGCIAGSGYEDLPRGWQSTTALSRYAQRHTDASPSQKIARSRRPESERGRVECVMVSPQPQPLHQLPLG